MFIVAELKDEHELANTGELKRKINEHPSVLLSRVPYDYRSRAHIRSSVLRIVDELKLIQEMYIKKLIIKCYL